MKSSKLWRHLDTKHKEYTTYSSVFRKSKEQKLRKSKKMVLKKERKNSLSGINNENAVKVLLKVYQLNFLKKKENLTQKLKYLNYRLRKSCFLYWTTRKLVWNFPKVLSNNTVNWQFVRYDNIKRNIKEQWLERVRILSNFVLQLNASTKWPYCGTSDMSTREIF